MAAAEWKKTKINLIDTPGYNIFINDTRASLVAADAVLTVVDAVAGVEVQTEKVWNFAADYRQPRAIVINRLDRERASFPAPSPVSTRASAAPRSPSNSPSA